MKKEKIAYLEMLRVIAFFCVIVNHTVNGEIFWQNMGGTKWFVLVTMFLFSEIAVPLFIMISGALLLRRVNDYQKSFARAARVALDILLFSLVYYIRNCYVNQTEFHLGEFFLRILREEITPSYWYLYMYLGLLLMLPLLQRMAAKMEKREYQYLMLITVVFLGTTPVAGHFISWLRVNPNFSNVLISVYVGTLFCGYYLVNYVEIKHVYAGVSVLILGFSTGFQVWATYMEAQSAEWYLYMAESYYFPNILSAAAVFYLARWLQAQLNAEWFWKGITVLGGATFGAYLVSDLLSVPCRVLFVVLEDKTNVVVAVLGYELAIFAGAMVIGMFLKRIPYLKKLL